MFPFHPPFLFSTHSRKNSLYLCKRTMFPNKAVPFYTWTQSRTELELCTIVVWDRAFIPVQYSTWSLPLHHNYCRIKSSGFEYRLTPRLGLVISFDSTILTLFYVNVSQIFAIRTNISIREKTITSFRQNSDFTHTVARVITMNLSYVMHFQL